jgi:tRNA A-37 threonylcarbamoyl transferase component Bud32
MIFFQWSCEILLPERISTERGTFYESIIAGGIFRREEAFGNKGSRRAQFQIKYTNLLYNEDENHKYGWQNYLYFVNWQRNISITELNGKKVVVKRNKSSKQFHDYILVLAYTLLSVIVCHPASPPRLGRNMIFNEGFKMRTILNELGVPTPSLVSISDDWLIEDYIDGGNLYYAFVNGIDPFLAFTAGKFTGTLHNAGYVFTDNKSQNYLVTTEGKLLRTDLSFIQKENSVYSRSMDVGSFLASVISFDTNKYDSIQRAFFTGYRATTKQSFPYLSIAIRNFLSVGLSPNPSIFKNMISNSLNLL